MEITDASKLIDHPLIRQPVIAHWADLGAGEGVFTLALSRLLLPGSTILAVDTNNSVRNIPAVYNEVNIEKRIGNFAEPDWQLPLLDGLLMANSLHFIKDKSKLLTQLVKRLKPRGLLLIVEYDTLQSNTWVPYPIDQESLLQLLTSLRLTMIHKIRERPSLYGRAPLYSMIAVKPA